MPPMAWPEGYDTFVLGGTQVVAQTAHAAGVRGAMAHRGTLFAYAAGQDGARALIGRGTAWATTLPDGADVVVRHSRHGGVLAGVTRDLFWAPTRAPQELATALRLRDAGVPTPEIIAYAVYPVWGTLCRADVVTRRLHGMDFPEAWRATGDESARLALIDAVAVLLRALQRAGAIHADLNLKNVFITRHGHTPEAVALDVDRVRFLPHTRDDIGRANLQRVLRSARKWRNVWGLDIDEARHLTPLALGAVHR